MSDRTSRRSFLLGAVGGAAVLTTLPSARRAPPPMGLRPQDGEAYWEMVRARFAFPEERVPMNAANLCPSPRSVAELVTELTRDVDADPSFQNRAKLAPLREKSRAAVAEHLGVSAEEIALVRNTSEANNVISNGLPLKPGDEVVVWDENHPTNDVAWDVRAARFGFAVRRVTLAEGAVDPEKILEHFTRAFTDRTRVLAITHVSNGSGLRLPVRALCDAAHRRDIHVHVDGAQTFGALAVDLRALDCDSYAASAHKWTCGPKELGVLFVRKERIAPIWPGIVGVGWGGDAVPDTADAAKFETLGQRDDACVAAMAPAIDFHRSIGREKVEARIRELVDRLKEGLVEAGASLVTPKAWEHSGGVCVIRVPRQHRRELFEKLYREHGIAGAPTGGLRLCPHVYNTVAHVQRAVAAVKEMRALLG